MRKSRKDILRNREQEEEEEEAPEQKKNKFDILINFHSHFK